MLPSCAGGEKNSTSVERLVKKSFRKNSASFKKTNKAVSAGKKKKKIRYWIFFFVRNYFYLIDIQSKRHQGDTKAALLRSLTRLRTHVNCLHCQLKTKNTKVVTAGTRLGLGLCAVGRLACLPCWNELFEAFPCWSTSRGTCSSGRQPVGLGSPGLARQTPGGRLAGRLLARQPPGSVGTRHAGTSPVEIKYFWVNF